MKYFLIIAIAAILALPLHVISKEQQDSKDNKEPAQVQKKEAARDTRANNKKMQNNRSVIINMVRPSSGERNRNFPSQQKSSSDRQHLKQVPASGMDQGFSKKKDAQNFFVQQLSRERNTVNVIHHHAYGQGEMRKKIQTLSVLVKPEYIVNREEVIHTDRTHSLIAYPKEDLDKRPLNSTGFSPRNFNNEKIRTHMVFVSREEWQEKMNGLSRTEFRPNQYYWHRDQDFNYCHYVDGSGYHWFGWYLGNRYFWTRYFSNRWWWYDADFDRWCFWNNGYWWWQDPNHMGDLYCYDDAQYLAFNSLEDNVAVTIPDSVNLQTYLSPDKTRMIKVVAETHDAFIYDTSIPPVFPPAYLASGVKDVIFSDISNGRPLEIILKLNDGSFDMFDGNGNPYGPQNDSMTESTNK